MTPARKSARPDLAELRRLLEHRYRIRTLPVSVPPGQPVEVGHRVSVTAGGHRITLRTWRLGGVEAVVATSSHPFPMPPGARGASGTGMAWSARLGTVRLYCVNGRQSELVAAPVPAAELARLAARLPRA